MSEFDDCKFRDDWNYMDGQSSLAQCQCKKAPTHRQFVGRAECRKCDHYEGVEWDGIEAQVRDVRLDEKTHVPQS